MASLVEIITANNTGDAPTSFIDDFTTNETAIDSAASFREIASLTFLTRNRQPGTVRKIRMKVPNGLADPDLTSIRIGFWNNNIIPSNFNGGQYTADIKGKFTLSAGTVETITLDTPVTIEDGTIVTIVVETTDIITGMFHATTSAFNLDSIFVDFDDTAATQRNFQGQGTQDPRVIPMELIMDPSNIQGMGDSIMEAYPNNRSYVNQQGVALITPDEQIIKFVADNYGWTYQNVGIAGERSDEGESRLARDVIRQKPKACVIQYGGNDWAANRTANEVFTSMSNMCDDLVANNIIPIVCSCTPFAPLTDVKSAIRRDYNSQLNGLAATHGAIVVQLDPILGQIRPSTGQLDDLQSAFAEPDTIHLSPLGNMTYANAIIAAIDHVVTLDESIAFSDSVLASKGVAVKQANIAESVAISDAVVATKLTAPVCGFTPTGFTSTGFAVCIPTGVPEVAESIGFSDAVTARASPFIFTEIMDLGDFEVEIV